jgi:hypothetical protein
LQNAKNAALTDTGIIGLTGIPAWRLLSVSPLKRQNSSFPEGGWSDV